ncbi:MAG: NUDIX hydrolase [Gemmatimonadota bacterium]
MTKDADSGAAEALRNRLAEALSGRERRSVPDSRADSRAAVALVLRPDAGRGASLLFIQRAEQEGDPWSGHMALPGGRWSPEDRELRATAIRETREETSLHLREAEILGALDDVHPASRHLPSVAVTPFVAWYAGDAQVKGNREVRDHVWIELDALRDPERRSTLTLSRGERTVIFPTIEYGEYTVWGLTFEIVWSFLEVLRSVVGPG